MDETREIERGVSEVLVLSSEVLVLSSPEPTLSSHDHSDKYLYEADGMAWHICVRACSCVCTGRNCAHAFA